VSSTESTVLATCRRWLSGAARCAGGRERSGRAHHDAATLRLPADLEEEKHVDDRARRWEDYYAQTLIAELGARR
jgi:hypothetical protein